MVKLLGAELHYLNLQKRLNRFSRNFFCILGIHHCQIQINIICKLSQYFGTLKFQSPGTAPKVGNTHFLAMLTLTTPLIRPIMIFRSRYCLDYSSETYFETFDLGSGPLGPILGQTWGSKGPFYRISAQNSF